MIRVAAYQATPKNSIEERLQQILKALKKQMMSKFTSFVFLRDF